MTPCIRCHFVPTDDGACICRVPTEDDVPLWEDDECPSGGAHYWLLRPESDTHECAFCGGER